MGAAVQSGPILQVITDNDRRGGQVFASDLHLAFESLGVSVRTVALAPASTDRPLEFEVLGPRRRHPTTLSNLRRAIGESSVVIGHGSTTLPMGALAVRGMSTPFVYRQISEQRFWVNTPGRRLRTRLALGSVDHVVALWRGAAEVLTSDSGVAPGDITVIPNGVPAERCPPVDASTRLAARRRFGLDPDRPTLLAIGAFAPEKGVDTLVRVMSRPELSGWQLLLVGAGPERDRLERLTAAAPEGSVTLHGPIESGAEAMAAADVIGLTSRGGDSMPAVLIEAGMMGIPAVATPIEGIVDIVIDGKSGRLVPVDDAAATASAVREVGEGSARFGAAAQDHCLESFEIGPVAERWLEVIERVQRAAAAR
jgi:glycosyltransferase involved in cell wall biosynthesis